MKLQQLLDKNEEDLTLSVVEESSLLNEKWAFQNPITTTQHKQASQKVFKQDELLREFEESVKVLKEANNKLQKTLAKMSKAIDNETEFEQPKKDRLKKGFITRFNALQTIEKDFIEIVKQMTRNI